jgi:hypothetical protein
MRDRILALIFVVIGFAVVNYRDKFLIFEFDEICSGRPGSDWFSGAVEREAVAYWPTGSILFSG